MRPSSVRTFWYDRKRRLEELGGYFKILIHQGGMELHLRLPARQIITHWLPPADYQWRRGSIDVARELPTLFSGPLMRLGILELECYVDEEEGDFVGAHRMVETPAEVR